MGNNEIQFNVFKGVQAPTKTNNAESKETTALHRRVLQK